MNPQKGVSKIFNKEIDYKIIKSELIEAYKFRLNKDNISIKDINALSYITIALIQLMNGCRISEAFRSYIYFVENQNIDVAKHILVSKTKRKRKNKSGDDEKTTFTKPRYRDLKFPTKWIDIEIIKCIDTVNPKLKLLTISKLKDRVLNYLKKWHNGCTTDAQHIHCDILLSTIKYLLRKKMLPK